MTLARSLAVQLGGAALLVVAYWVVLPASASAADPSVTSACAGTTNGNTFTLTADCTTTEPLTLANGQTLDGAGHTITGNDPAGGFFKGGLVTNAAAGDTITIRNLTVSGPAGGFGTDCAPPLTGIFFNDASGSVTNVTVKDITQHGGCQLGLGIRANGVAASRTVTLTNVTVTGYQKGGLVASGSMTMNVSDSTVGPPDAAAGRPAQNGVQYSNTAPGSSAGAGGSVTNTNIVGSFYPTGDTDSTAVLLYGANNVTLANNTITGVGTNVGVFVTGNSSGVLVESNSIGATGPPQPGTGIYLATGSSATLVGNTFSGWTTNIIGTTQAPCVGTTSGTTFTLTADCVTTVPLIMPDGYTLNGAGHTITANDPADGVFKGGIVTNAAPGATMTIQNLTVRGPAGGFKTDCAPLLTGIFFNDASGSVTNVTVRDITQHSGCILGLGIRADGITAARTVTLTDVTVTGYQRGGLVASGSMTMNVSGSTVGPPDDAAGRPAQNAVQYSILNGNRASGSVTNSTVVGLYYPGDVASTAFLLLGAANVTLERNTITGTGTQVGVYVTSNSTGIKLTENKIGVTPVTEVPETWGVYVADGSSATLTCNTFSGWTYPFEGTTQAPCESGAIKITKTSNATPPVPLAGATFSITGQGLATLAPTDSTGTACVDGLLYGDYVVTETAPPPGYQPGTPNSKTVTISADSDCNGFGTPVAAPFTNAPLPESGAIRISKTSSTTPPSPLAGATFSITGQGLATLAPTDSTGTACVDGLLYGNYTVTETAPPLGYQSGTPSTKTVTVSMDGDCNGGGSPTAVSFTNAPTSCLTPTVPVPTFTVVPPATSTSTLTLQPTATRQAGGTPPPPILPPGGGAGPNATATSIPPSGGGVPNVTATSIPPSGGAAPNASATLTPAPGGGARPNAMATATITTTPTRTPTPSSGTAGLMATQVATPTPTMTPTPTRSGSAPVGGGVGVVVPVPTPGAHTPDQVVVLAVAIGHLEQREAAPVQVPPPPVQLPPVADGIYDFVMTAFTEAQQTPVEVDPCALPEISMASSANPGTALVGDPVSFTYTVTNPGTVPLTDLQIASALPSGISYVSASSQGAINRDTGYVEWALESGLAPGASTQLSVSATIASPGTWTNNACTAGQDMVGNLAKDCASTTVVGGVLTVTPTPSATPTVALTPTAGTPTPTPMVSQPIATPPAAVSQPIATPPAAVSQPIATPPAAVSQPIATPPAAVSQPIATAPPAVSQPIAPPPAPVQPVATPPPAQPTEPEPSAPEPVSQPAPSPQPVPSPVGPETGP